jgi:glucokinase
MTPVSEIPFSLKKPVLAVDIGGTKVAAGLVSQDGEVLARCQEPTCQNGPEEGIAQIMRLLENLLAGNRLSAQDTQGIGIGIPAVLEPDTDLIIWGPNLAGWRNVALRPALEEHFNLPVCVEYDGHTAVLGEWWVGEGRRCKTLADVIVGTGVGGGMILDGRLVRGVNRLAGAVGWFAFNDEEQPGNPEARSLGYWESFVAGPGIARRAIELLASGAYPQSQLSGEAVDARAVFNAAQQGDPLALRVTGETVRLLGLGIANIVSLINPELVVLGGSVGSNAGFLIPDIRQVVLRWAQPISARSLRIVPSRLNGEAGLLGAAYGLLLRCGQS